MKTYKLWIEIEGYDDETQEYHNATKDGTAEPVPIGNFDTLEAAVEAAESMECHFDEEHHNQNDLEKCSRCEGTGYQKMNQGDPIIPVELIPEGK